MDHIASTSGINSLSSSAPLKHEDSRAVSICSSCQDSRFQGREVSLVQRRSEHQPLPEGPAQCPVCKKAVGPRSASPANQANEMSKPRQNRCHDLRRALGMDNGRGDLKVQDLMDEGVILPLEERSRALKEALGINDNGSCSGDLTPLARRILPQTFSLATGMYPVMPRHAPALWQMDVSLSPKELLRALTVLQRSIDSDGGKASGQRRLIQKDHIKLLVQIAETMPADKLSRIMLSSFKTEGEVGIGYIKLLLGMASNPLTHRLLDAVCDNLNPEQKSILMRMALALNTAEGSQLFRALKHRKGTLTPEELPKALEEVLGRNRALSHTVYGCVIDYANDLFDMGARLDQPKWMKAMWEAESLQFNRGMLFNYVGDQHITFLKRDEKAAFLWELGMPGRPSLEGLHRALKFLQQSIDSDGGKASDQRRRIQEDNIKLLIKTAESMPSNELSWVMRSSFKTESEVSCGYIKLLLRMASAPSSHRLLDAVCDNLNPEQKSILMRMALTLNTDEGSQLFRALKDRKGTLTPEELPKVLEEVLGRNSSRSHTIYGCVIDYANDLFDMGARLDQPEWEKAMHEAHYLQAHPADIFQRMGNQHIKS